MPELNDLREEPIMNAGSGRPEISESPGKEYTPRKGEFLRNHEINIRFLSVGCVIRVGCKEVPFTSIEEGMRELNDYVKDPYQSTKRWNEIFNKNE